MTLTSAEAKWISMLAVGLGSFAIGVVPTCFLTRGRAVAHKLILSSLLCFGGGVLLATSLLHMLPETRELLPKYAELVFCCGFLLLYLVDEIVHFFWVKNDAPAPHTPGSTLVYNNRPAQSNNQLQHRFASTCLHHGLPNRRVHSGPQSYRDEIYEIGFNAASRNIAGSSGQDGIRSLSYESNNVAATNRANALANSANNVNRPKVTQYGTLSPLEPESTACCGEEETFLCHGNHTEPCANTNTGHVGLSLALTLHALLEGLAIGLQRGSSEVLLLVGAVVSHKFVVAFCLGLELAGSSSTALKNVLAIALFSGGSVVGIGIGMLAVKVQGSWAAILMPTLQGLAGGTLLYVTVSEVLPRERARWHRNVRRSAGIIQFVSVLIGFTVIYALNRYLDSHHDVMPRQ